MGAPPLEWDEAVAKVSGEWAAGLEGEECVVAEPTAEWTAEKYAEAGGVLEPLGVNLAFACCDQPAPQVPAPSTSRPPPLQERRRRREAVLGCARWAPRLARMRCRGWGWG